VAPPGPCTPQGKAEQKGGRTRGVRRRGSGEGVRRRGQEEGDGVMQNPVAPPGLCTRGPGSGGRSHGSTLLLPRGSEHRRRQRHPRSRRSRPERGGARSCVREITERRVRRRKAHLCLAAGLVDGLRQVVGGALGVPYAGLCAEDPVPALRGIHIPRPRPVPWVLFRAQGPLLSRSSGRWRGGCPGPWSLRGTPLCPGAAPPVC